MKKCFIGCYPGIGERAMVNMCIEKSAFYYSLKNSGSSSKALVPIIYG